MCARNAWPCRLQPWTPRRAEGEIARTRRVEVCARVFRAGRGMTMDDHNTEDRFAGFLAPDAILPMQFFQSLRSKGRFDGERRHMIAILEDAVNVFMKQVHATDPKARQ